MATSALRQAIAAPPAPVMPAANAVPAPVPPQAAAGVVGKALAMNAAAQDAANTQVANDPLAQRYEAEAAQTDAANAEAAATVQGNMGRMTEIINAPEPERAPVPRLKPLPAAPVEEKKDPMRVMGQFLPVLAALGAYATAQPATNALMAATAAINAAKAQDKDEFDKQHKIWLENLKLTADTNSQLVSEYNLAMNDRSATMAERMSKVQAIAALNRDAIVLAGLKGGSVDQIAKLWQMRQAAGAPIIDLLKDVSDDERQRAEAKSRETIAWAELYARQNPAVMSQGDAVGTILNKGAKQGWASLTPDENRTLAEYKALNESRAPTIMGATPYGAPAAAGPPAGPTGTGAQPAGPGAAGPGAVATSAVAKRADGVYLPTSAADMANIPVGAKFLNPADGRVLPKAR